MGQEVRTRYPEYNVLDKWSSPDWDDEGWRAYQSSRVLTRRRIAPSCRPRKRIDGLFSA